MTWSVLSSWLNKIIGTLDKYKISNDKHNFRVGKRVRFSRDMNAWNNLGKIAKKVDSEGKTAGDVIREWKSKWKIK